MPKIVVQTEAATETSPGAIAEGLWDVIDDNVVVTDLSGRPIGKEKVPPGDNPEIIAKRILRRARLGRGDFSAPIRYPPLSLV